jgi:hypothetical protein
LEVQSPEFKPQSSKKKKRHGSSRKTIWEEEGDQREGDEGNGVNITKCVICMCGNATVNHYFVQLTYGTFKRF